MAVFTGAADALTVGVAIQQALDRHSGSGGPARLEVRIGLSARDVTVEGGRRLRDSGAARLCALAEGGQIVASEIVRALAGSAGGHRFRPVGALDLKGLPVPVAACEVAWESLPVAAAPLPALLTDIGCVFVGRDAELGQLGQLW
jgi:class 3 adenylate cyclase